MEPNGREGKRRGKRREQRDSQEMAAEGTDSKTVGYFRRVGDVIKQGFPDSEEKDLFIANVMAEIRGSEFELTTSPSVSFVLQQLLPHLPGQALCPLLRALTPLLPLLGRHRSAVHVLETALRQTPRLAGCLRDETPDGGDATTSLEEALRAFGEEVRRDLVSYASHTHASYLVRTLVQVFAGVLLDTSPRRPNAREHSGKVTEFDVPETFNEELKAIAKILMENVSVFVTQPVASVVYQTILTATKDSEPTLCAELTSAVISYLSSLSQGKDSSCSLQLFLKDRTGSRLLETVITVADRKLFQKLLKGHFLGDLVSLSLHPMANFTIQRLLSSCPSPRLFCKIFDELLPGLETVLAEGHTGVITELISGCARHKVRQQEALTGLFEAFHCGEPKSRQITCLPLFLSLQTYEILYPEGHKTTSEQTLTVTAQGSVLAQQLMMFAETEGILSSLSGLSPAQRLPLACHPSGSHVLSAFLTSPTITPSHRAQLSNSFSGQWLTLACSKHGSRVLDQIWNSASSSARQDIAEELAQSEAVLLRDAVGHHIARNLSLSHFIRRRKDWESHQATDSKKRKIFSEILEA